jgi:hypothetical protein
MLILANLLLLAGGGLMILMAASMKGSGPEGPVGAHMVTAPLAIAQALAVAFGLAAGCFAGLPPGFGWLGTAVGCALPGYVVGLTVLPILVLDQRWREWARAGVFAAVAGCFATIDGAQVAIGVAIAGGVLVLAGGGFGYGLLLALWWQMEKGREATARADAERMQTFDVEQRAFELGEWQKLGTNAELWQLIQYAHARHDDVRTQCQQRIRELPDLDAKMDALLRTGWAEHALDYVVRDYPHGRAPLVAALAPFLDAECSRWESYLKDAPTPDTWGGNLLKYVDTIRVVQADGGDLRAQAERWRTMLRGFGGLAPLASRIDAA